MRVTPLAEVARDYVEIRILERRIAIAAENIKSQRRSVTLTEDRFRTGLASELDVRQARSLLATTRSEVPVREDTARADPSCASACWSRRDPMRCRRISRGVRRSPGAAASDALAVRIPVGLPSDLLRRRPDVRRAERQVAAATARIGVARPISSQGLRSAGLAGLESISAGDLFTSGSHYFTARPDDKLKHLRGRAAPRPNVTVQDAARRTRRYSNRYVKADAHGAGGCRGQPRSLWQGAPSRHVALVSAAERELALHGAHHDLYVHGLGTYLAVLDAERAQYASEDALVQGDEALVLDLVATYKALGGGWTPPAQEVAAR